MIAEMETGEGKTLTATLPACTAALAGLPVHVITVNDYLTARDAEWMAPVYRMLGLVGRRGGERQGPASAARGLRLRRHVLHQQGAHLRLPARPDRARVTGEPHPAVDRARGREPRAARPGSSCAGCSSRSSTRPTACSSTRRARRSSSPAGRTRRRRRRCTSTALAMVAKLAGGRGLRDRRRRAARAAHREGQAAAHRRRPRGCPASSAARAAARSSPRRRWSRPTCSSATSTISSATTRSRSSTSPPGRILPDRSWEQGLHQMVEAKEGCRAHAASRPRGAHDLSALLPALPAARGDDRHGARDRAGAVVGVPAAGGAGADEPAGAAPRSRRERCTRRRRRSGAASSERVRELHRERAARARRHALGRRVRGAEHGCWPQPGSSTSCSTRARTRRRRRSSPRPGRSGGSPSRRTWPAAARTSGWRRAWRRAAACT